MKRRDEDTVDVSEGCPVHSLDRRRRLQTPELKLYRCTCAWDARAAATRSAS